LYKGEFTDTWGCLFAKTSEGVGSHSTRPIIKTIDDWKEYVDNYIPVINKQETTDVLRDIVNNNEEYYVVTNIWRTFYERMYMLIGIEELWINIALSNELFLRMLKVLRDYTIEIIKTTARSGIDAIYLADD